MTEMSKNRRIELQEILEEILGSKNVYFQPPENMKMKYPAIVYELSDINVEYGDDSSYSKKRKYDVKVIDKDPDSEIPDKLIDLEYVYFDRFFVADNLNHFSFRLYY